MKRALLMFSSQLGVKERRRVPGKHGRRRQTLLGVDRTLPITHSGVLCETYAIQPVGASLDPNLVSLWFACFVTRPGPCWPLADEDRFNKFLVLTLYS